MESLFLENEGLTITKKELKQQLKDGLILHFDNEKFCNEMLSDDYRGGTIELRQSFGDLLFTTWFNGTINHTSKGIESSLRNLERLCKKFGCNPTEINDEL